MMKTALLVAGVFVIVAVAMIWELAAWNQCLDSGHSWWYCLRLFG